jgi:hypothetical protein
VRETVIIEGVSICYVVIVREPEHLVGAQVKGSVCSEEMSQSMTLDGPHPFRHLHINLSLSLVIACWILAANQRVIGRTHAGMRSMSMENTDCELFDARLAQVAHNYGPNGELACRRCIRTSESVPFLGDERGSGGGGIE